MPKSLLFIKDGSPTDWQDLPAELTDAQVEAACTKAQADNANLTVVAHDAADFAAKLQIAIKPEHINYDAAAKTLTVDTAAVAAHNTATATASIKAETAREITDSDMRETVSLLVEKVQKLEAEQKRLNSGASTAITNEVAFNAAATKIKNARQTEQDKIAALAPPKETPNRRSIPNPPPRVSPEAT